MYSLPLLLLPPLVPLTVLPVEEPEKKTKVYRIISKPMTKANWLSVCYNDHTEDVQKKLVQCSVFIQEKDDVFKNIPIF